MGTYGREHQIIINDTIELLRDQIRRDMFDGAEEATRIKVFAASGTIDPFTEEVTYYEDHTWVNVSGIVRRLGEDDKLLGLGGRIKVGDTSVLYPWNTISGVFLQTGVKEIEIVLPGLSGIYQVAGHMVEAMAGYPIFLKVALTLDSND